MLNETFHNNIVYPKQQWKVNAVKLNEAVARRVSALCAERNMTQYQLYMKSGVPQSTLSTIMSCAYPSVKLRIVYEICEGFGISLEEFFTSPLFSRETLDD